MTATKTVSSGLIDDGASGYRIGPSPYLGQVTTRCILPTNTNSGTPQSMSETWFPLTDDVTSVQLVYTTVRNNSTGLEVALGGSATIKVGAGNLVSGTFSQVLFSGSSTGTITNGALLVSDPIVINGKRRQLFPVRTFYNSASGIVWHVSNATAIDKFIFGTGLTDVTLGGAMTSTNGGGNTYTYGPVGIIAQTTRGTVFIAGHSIAAGLMDVVSDLLGDIGVFGRVLGADGVGYINGAISGSKASVDKVGSNMTIRLALAAYCSSVVLMDANNDLGTGGSAAQAATDMSAVAALFGTKPVFASTETPRVTTSDNGVTLANQTTDAVYDPKKAAFNALVRAGLTGFAGYVDTADALESDRDSGKFAVGYLPGVTTGISLMEASGSPRVHPNKAGNERIVRSGVMRSNIFAR